MTPDKLLQLRELAGKVFLGTEDIYPLYEGLKALLAERCVDGVCSRCKATDNLERVLEWKLCPECRFDAKELFGEQVKAGRLPNTSIGTRGSRWTQIMLIIERDTFVTARSFSLATGVTCHASTDILRSYRRRGRLKHDRPTKRYTLTEHAPLKKLPRGTRWARVVALIERDGYVSSQSFADEYNCQYSYAKQLLSDCRCAGLIETDPKTHRSTITEAGTNERRAMVKASSIKKVSQHFIGVSGQKTG